MKNTIICMVLFFVSTTILKAQEQLHINTDKSEIKWFGEYAFYFGGHHGTIGISKGHFIKTNDVITGGEFVIDMDTIICLDIDDEEANAGLVDHLKHEDFFEVEKFPEAKIVITKVKYHTNTTMRIEADLTIKEITLPVNFEAEVDYEKQQMTTKFKIDRQRWGVDYNSKLRDGAIADGIGFEIKLSL